MSKRKQDHDESSEKEITKKSKQNPSPTTSTAAGAIKLNLNQIYFSKIKNVDGSDEINSNSISFAEILAIDKDDFIESAQFNYIHDIEWLRKQYPLQNRDAPLTLIHGYKDKDNNKAESNLKADCKNYSNIRLIKATLSNEYSTHHTKMMLLLYKTGMRVVIHTGNLMEDDWQQKTQGIWVSQLFPRIPDSKKVEPIRLYDSKTEFKEYLMIYLEYYQDSKLQSWIEQIKIHDMRSANVFLIGSVPYTTKKVGLRRFGHMRLRKVLTDNNQASDEEPSTHLVFQFSSIGSLGPSASSWLCNEFSKSMNATSATKIVNYLNKPICIYPTHENIRDSYESYDAGASFPYNKSLASKQSYLEKFLHLWKADSVGRTKAPPHIKSYAKFSADYTKLYWFLLTSANLSKAAWGFFENQEYIVRSYELGVLFIPEFSDDDKESTWFSIDGEKKKFLVPYDLPPVKYAATDKPWFFDSLKEFRPNKKLVFS